MKGHFYKRGCICKKKRCTCGATWTFVVDIGIEPQTGKRKQKSKSGFATKQEAEAALTSLIHELNQETFVQESNILFKTFAKEWLGIYQESNNIKPGTIRVRKHELEKLMPYFSRLKLKDINRKRYQDALNALKEKGYADNTLDGIHRTGRMLFRKALELGILKKDPTEFTYLKKDPKTVEELEEEEVPKYLEKEELAKFLDIATSKGLEMDFLIFLILAYSGIRVGELVALKWKDIDFKENTIRITKTYYNPINNTLKYELVTPKTKNSRRTIVVENEVMEVLKFHKKSQEKLVEQLGNSYYKKDFIFAKTDKYPGYPIFIKTVENRMRRLLKLAGLNEQLTPHSLRHTHTSLLAEAKVGLEEIMDRLGHTNDDTTRKIYLHVTKEMKKEASRKFGQLMKSLH